MSVEIEEIQEVDWSRAQIRSSLGDPLARTWVAYVPDQGSAGTGGREPDGGEVDGVAGRGVPGVMQGLVLARRVGDLLEIDRVGVRPSMRRRGIVRGLLGALIAEEGKKGLAETRLELAAAQRGGMASLPGAWFRGRRQAYTLLPRRR